MKTLRKSVLAMILAGIASASAAQQANFPLRGPMTFSVFDSDGNGVVTEQEFNQARAQRRATRAPLGRPMRGARNAPPFAYFDRNSDAGLTPRELAIGHQGRMRPRGAGRGPCLGRGPGRGMGRPGYADFDLNGDGVVEAQEFNESRARRISERARQGRALRGLAGAPAFSEIDANGDERLSPQELAAAQARRRAQMGR